MRLDQHDDDANHKQCDTDCGHNQMVRLSAGGLDRFRPRQR